MAIITCGEFSYTVDHASKGIDFIHGFDANGKLVVSFEGITDFSLFTFDGTYMAPEQCLQEECNAVKYVNGKLVKDDGSQVPISKKLILSLASAGWVDLAQTVDVDSVTADNVVIVSPTTESKDVYGEAGCYCSAQAEGKLTFVVEETPSVDLLVNIVVLN